MGNIDVSASPRRTEHERRSATPDRTVVLVVEDLAPDPLALEAMLERDDIEVLIARSEAEALEVLRDQDVALAIIDVQVPGLDGFALAALMRREERTPYVPIIFVTTNVTDRSTVLKGYETGAVDVLCKPIDPRVLRGKINAFVTLERQRQMVLETERTHEMFVGILGHDLRTPLHAIVLSAELALRCTTEEPVRALLERIRRNVERMLQMVDQLLDLTRLRVGCGIALSLGCADLRQLAEQAVLEFDGVRQGIQIEVVGDPVGTWDAARVLQILSNLVCNAIRHGSVELPIRIAIDGAREETVVLRVHNSGSPIPDELKRVLFEPFRSSVGWSRERPGLGLGLYITQQLVLAHGGSVSFESSREAGTCFRVSLPRHCQDRGHRGEAPAGGYAAP
jgi:signal transduction histidine kinase